MDLKPHRFLHLICAGVLLALAACTNSAGASGVASLAESDGASDSKQADAEKSHEDLEAELVKWTECMREHGVDIPDAKVSEDGGVMITSRAVPAEQGNVDINLDDMEKATKECGDPPRGPGGGPKKIDLEELKENGLKLAQCMRDNGVADFPDPDFSDMGPGVSKEARGGAIRIGSPFGDIDMNDPEVQKAFETCNKEVGGKGSFSIGFSAKATAN